MLTGGEGTLELNYAFLHLVDGCGGAGERDVEGTDLLLNVTLLLLGLGQSETEAVNGQLEGLALSLQVRHLTIEAIHAVLHDLGEG